MHFWNIIQNNTTSSFTMLGGRIRCSVCKIMLKLDVAWALWCHICLLHKLTFSTARSSRFVCVLFWDTFTLDSTNACTEKIKPPTPSKIRYTVSMKRKKNHRCSAILFHWIIPKKFGGASCCFFQSVWKFISTCKTQNSCLR